MFYFFIIISVNNLLFFLDKIYFLDYNSTISFQKEHAVKKIQTEPKSSLLLYVVFLVSGILVTGLCLDKFIVLYYTNEISFTLNGMLIEGGEAFFSSFTFFIAGLLFIVYGILEYNKLLKSRTILRVIATILLILIIGLTLYYSYQYYITIKSEYMWH